MNLGFLFVLMDLSFFVLNFFSSLITRCKKMKGAVLVAVTATIGNLLQGWDNATIGGAVVYIKKELELGASVEGLIVAMSLIGATLITTCSGTISDVIGRRPMLVMSSLFYITSGLIMLWSPNVYILLMARLLDGFAVGLAATLVPVYISETAPPEIRGQLNTLPQFFSSGGTFLAYSMIFGMSFLPAPSWRFILGIIFVPSLVYFGLTVFYLPESPRWLVSKGKMLEARRVLQQLRGREDVSGNMALLVEGLTVGGETSIEEYIISPANEPLDKDHIKLYGPEEGLSWIARPVASHHSTLLSCQVSNTNPNVPPLMDPLVTLFTSVHEKLPDAGASTLFPNFGSMFSTTAPEPKNEQEWDEESLQPSGDGSDCDEGGGHTESEENLRTPLISRQATSVDKDGSGGPAREGSTGIGGGWQLTWQWSGKGEGGEEGFRRVYLHQHQEIGSRRGSIVSVLGGGGDEGEFVHAAALVSQPALVPKELAGRRQPVGPAVVHPLQNASGGPSLVGLSEPGVKRALVVGIGIQMLQQLSGISGVLFYTPQILQQAGVGVLLSKLGLGSDSATFLISAFTNFLMLPSIAIAMRFMDVAGRRSLLLSTIPVLVVSLIFLLIVNILDFGTMAHAVISTASVVTYFCFFVMGFGPIPNILCSEIFPTRVRGICIAICALVFWICDFLVTYTMPILLNSVGLVGVAGFFASVCFVSFVFVFLRVPETKGMPLEVITEFFAVGGQTRR
ncbi:Monosaccharide-sensing protein 2 [Striga hermonthica]|uniref:Monosaccharide-sensing protein 2 n=1 Tax=Striga hermonthica TaxID=68872 RepID=A0A9N7NN24_STRHE|nr:Monosaccharide-sensing protein 2 [Striga hermonthica]